MDRGQFASLAIAALCMTTLGVAATTLDETVSTTPDDVFNPNLDTLPLGQDSAKHIDRELDANRGQPASDAKKPRDTSGGGQASQQSQSESSSATAPTHPPAFPDQWLGPFVRLLLALVVVGLTAGLVYRYRERLAALLLAALPVGDSTDSDGHGTATDPWEDGDFGDDVERAWHAMVTEADIERPWTKTPDECRRRAVDAGLNPEAVSRLTETFRRVRYTEGPAAGDHERRARESLARLDAGGQPR